MAPKIIFADDGYVYAGKTINLAHQVQEWSNGLSQVNKGLTDIVIIPYCDLKLDLSRVPKACLFGAFIDHDAGTELIFAPQAFSHPASILYSSGTLRFFFFRGLLSYRSKNRIQTGISKCLVHSTEVSLCIIVALGGSSANDHLLSKA